MHTKAKFKTVQNFVFNWRVSEIAIWTEKAPNYITKKQQVNTEK